VKHGEKSIEGAIRQSTFEEMVTPTCLASFHDKVITVEILGVRKNLGN
jgi:hypothetical protein